jgi:hypothetical protein
MAAMVLFSSNSTDLVFLSSCLLLCDNSYYYLFFCLFLSGYHLGLFLNYRLGLWLGWVGVVGESRFSGLVGLGFGRWVCGDWVLNGFEYLHQYHYLYLLCGSYFVSSLCCVWKNGRLVQAGSDNTYLCTM